MLSELCFWILRILLEQPDQEIPLEVQNQNQQQENDAKTAMRLVLGVWLMMSLILVNGFRGIIKSDYTLDFPFASDPKWNSSMDFLKDASFFTYYTQIDWKCRDSNVKFPRPFNMTLNFDVNNGDKKPSFLRSMVLSAEFNKNVSRCESLCHDEC